MQVIVVNGQEVIKCPHCNGTGNCKNASPIRYDENNVRLVVLECSRCGRGTPATTIFVVKPPVCAVCGGKGYNRI